MSKSDKWIDDLYQRMHGFKTVERSDVQHGQSEWYYIDPRYDDGRRQIDVANESSINPQLNGILADDMDKNPENYYIWRTQGDDKVRGAHAAREGLIFNRHIPPKGGNPGEDYNCRCWAEPYEPEKYQNKQMIVDLGGLDMFKELTKELNPVDLNIKSLPQYAANDKSGVATDATYSSNDEYLYVIMWKNIRDQENVMPYPYLDTKGFITIGAGAYVNDWKTFKNLNVTVNGKPATEAQKLEAYNHMRQLSDKKDANGNFTNHNRSAKLFEYETNIRISDAEARKLAQNHMNNDLAHLRKEFSDFDSFPLPLKEVLLDIQYNVKGGISEKKWPKLYNAIREKNVFGKDGIVNNVNRPDVGTKRNNWAKERASSISF